MSILGCVQKLPANYLRQPRLYGQLLGHVAQAREAISQALLDGSEVGKSKYLAIFSPNFFPMPPTIRSIVDNWDQDYEFCRQFLQGVNPFLIKIVDDISEVPQVCLSIRCQSVSYQDCKQHLLSASCYFLNFNDIYIKK